MQSNFSKYLQIVVVVIGLVLAGNLAQADTNTANDETRIVAKVNDRQILFSQLKPAISAAQGKFRKYGAGASSMSDETRKRIQSEELERQIAFELLVQAGEKTVAKEIEKKVDEKISAIKANLKKDAAYRNQVRRQLLVDEYLAKKVDSDLKVPEAELKNYYAQNAKSFMESESVRVSHILIKIPLKGKPEEVAQARREMERIRSEIVGGKDFAEMAKLHSGCSSSKAGGDLGYIKHNYMPQEFDKVAFTLKIGDLSDVVKTRHGFHLIKVFDRKPERVPEFTELKDFIEKHLLKEARKKRLEEIVSELRREAKVEYF